MTTAWLGYPLEELGARGAGHTASEIAQQPDVWREVARATASRCEETAAFLQPLLARADLRIVLTGAGSSAFAGQILAPALSARLRRRVDAVPTTDIVADPGACFAEDRPTLLVSLARSGDSPESVAATELADQLLSDVHHLVLTCNAAGELHRRHVGSQRSLVLLMPERSNDEGFAMTSSFTSMLLAAWLTLGGQAAGDEGLVERLAVAAEKVLVTYGPAARALAERGYQRVVYLGSGALTGLAHESALKLLELTAGGVVTYFDSALGFRHGPKSVLDDRTLVLVYVSNDGHTRQYDLDLTDELRRTLARDDVVAISARGSESLDADTWWIEGLEDAADASLSLPFVVCAQLVGLHFSLTLGRTPDNPCPSGEVNRVVQGVTIHPFPS